MNKVFLIGRLTRDPELRYTETRIACAEFDLAINNGKDTEGNERPADFINVVIWEKQAENLAKYQKKGNKVAVEGAIKTQKWEGEDGKNHYKTYVLARNIEYLDSKRETEPMPEEPDYLTRQYQSEESNPFLEMGKQVEAEFTDDEMPF